MSKATEGASIVVCAMMPGRFTEAGVSVTATSAAKARTKETQQVLGAVHVAGLPLAGLGIAVAALAAGAPPLLLLRCVLLLQLEVLRPLEAVQQVSAERAVKVERQAEQHLVQDRG